MWPRKKKSGASGSPSSDSIQAAHKEQVASQPGHPSGKTELTYEMCEQETPFFWSSGKKWWVLTVIFLVQTSMNFNTSLYSNALGGMSEEFGISEQEARDGAALFLILYAFGCELWAPWSEEFGRRPIMQASLFLVNVFCLPVALAPNFQSVLAGRCLGGLSSAGGSVTLGMIADMFDSDSQQFAVAYIVLSSVGGSILGPIVGGFVQQFLDWRWCMWIQLIFGGAVQLLHLFTVPETRTTVVLDHIAKKRRKAGENVWGPNELNPVLKRMSVKEILQTWARPFIMFAKEPIVLTLSLLSGFSDALIFMMIQSFALVYQQWGFNDWQLGLSFVPIGIGYLIAWASFIWAIRRNMHERAAKPGDEHAQYESRLWWLLYTVPCLPIGLLIFALTCNGPPVHWIGTMVAAGIIGIANYAIYMATIDYMICAYGPFSASATGGNGFSRDFLAGVLTWAATPFFQNIPGPTNKPLMNANMILFAISCLLVLWVYVIYWKGPTMRKNSPFAQTLAKEGADRKEAAAAANAAGGAARPEAISPAEHDGAAAADPEKQAVAGSGAPTPSGVRTPAGGDGTHTPGGTRAKRPGLGAGSRTSSYQFSRDAASRNASRNASRRPSTEEARSGTVTPSASAAMHAVHQGDLAERLNRLGRIESEQV